MTRARLIRKMVAVSVGVAFLAGCASSANDGSPATEPSATKAPESHQTCEEYAAELKSAQPQPGSAEWEQYVDGLRIPYVEGQPHDEVLLEYAWSGIHAMSSGVQDFPLDLETLKDCRERVRLATADSTDLLVNGEALVELLGNRWRIDAANQALIDPNGELGAAPTTQRVESFAVHSFIALALQVTSEVPGLSPDFTIDEGSMELGETPDGVVEGRVTVIRTTLGVADDFIVGGKLNALNGSWISVGVARN